MRQHAPIIPLPVAITFASTLIVLLTATAFVDGTLQHALRAAAALLMLGWAHYGLYATRNPRLSIIFWVILATSAPTLAWSLTLLMQ